MTTHAVTPPIEHPEVRAPARRRERLLAALVPLGRALFAAIFLAAAPGHFSSGLIRFAASAGVPLAGLLVPLSGVLAIVGGLSVFFGLRARLGALLLVVFLVPITFKMHAFWAVQDPGMAQLQQVMFMKNLSMLGGALLLAYFGAGPYSFDERRRAANGSSRRTPRDPR
jgi:putative oxidoreductase